MAGVGIGEQQVELVRAQLPGNRGALVVDLAFQVLVAFRQLLELDQVSGAPFEAVPRADQITQLGRFSRQLPGALGVVPDPGSGELGV